MTTIVYLTGIPKHKPALKAHKNQCSHLHRNINCLESLIKKIMWYLWVSITASIVMEQNNKSFTYWDHRLKGSLRHLHYLEWVCLSTWKCCWDALSATEWNLSRRFIGPMMWSYHCCFDSKAADMRSIPSCSCLDGLAGPSIMKDLLVLTVRQALTSKNKPVLPSTECIVSL